MAYKPDKTLTQLEEEPESGFMGCTHSEIVAAMQKAIISALVATLLFSIVMAWQIAGILSIVVAVVVFLIFINKASNNRADKPLYYHKHLKTHVSSVFIQPPKVYQIERNNK